MLCLLATSQLGVTMVNWLATLLVTPRLAAANGFLLRHCGGGADARGRPDDAHQRSEPSRIWSRRSKSGSWRNRDAHLHFGLLTDFPDARAGIAVRRTSRCFGWPRRERAQSKVRATNPRAKECGTPATATRAIPRAPVCSTCFTVLGAGTPRNAVWMGHERKRGKLGDLNALLARRSRGRFSLIVGATAILSQVKYVITLDTDTQLPRDAARQLVGAMAHPLNTPRFDESGRDTSREVVTSGYGILQPRVSVSLPGTNRSRYARLYGGEPGIDQYTRTVSDVYQDVFDEGSFIGKGIYDVDAFERALNGRFPANRILSHDLLEGCYARAGLLSDAEVYEDFPARYGADVARRQRWIRGDWQLVGWLRRRVQGPDGRRERNPLSMLSQWKVFDNLRRSLTPAALTLLLLLGWTVLSSAWFWTAIVVAILLRAVGHCVALRSGRQAAPRFRFGQHLAAVAGARAAARRAGVARARVSSL